MLLIIKMRADVLPPELRTRIILLVMREGNVAKFQRKNHVEEGGSFNENLQRENSSELKEDEKKTKRECPHTDRIPLSFDIQDIFFFFFPRSDKQVVWLSGCLVRNILLVRSIALLLFGLRFVSRLAHLKLKLVDSQVLLLLVLSRDLRFVASFPGSFFFYTLSSLVSPKRLSNMSFLSAKHKEKQIPRGDMQEEDSQDDTRETK